MSINHQRIHIVIALLLAVALSAAGRGYKSISLPPSMVEGVLPNGLHYIILPNALPRHNVECRLVMRVGSINETDAQRGAAHFLEHMVFNGSKHFPGNRLVEFFEAQGMKYGRDINAFTGFDRTVYWFSLPVENDHDALVDSTLLAMGDILTSLTLDEKRTQRERGIILEELRGYDTHDAFYDLKIGTTNRYARHMPLGRAEDIRRIDRQTLVDFYQRWYGPQTATVVIVGNINSKATESKIKRFLGTLSPRGCKPQAIVPLQYEPGTKLMRVVDSLQQSLQLDLIIPHPTILNNNLELILRRLRSELAVSMLDNRLQQRHVRAQVSDNWYLADKNHLALTFKNASPDTLLQYITAASDEIKRLALRGPEAKELAWAVSRKQARLKPSDTEKMSAAWCDDLVDQIILGDRCVYCKQETAWLRQQLAQTRATDIRAVAQAWLSAAGQTLLAGLNDNGQSQRRIDEQAVRRAWNRGNSRRATAFKQPQAQPVQATDAAIMPLPPILAASHSFSPTLVGQRQTYPELGLTEWTLTNGLRLRFRPTCERSGNVAVTALSRGGIADLPDSLYNRLKDAVAYVDMGGITTVSPDTLSRLITAREMMMNVGIENYWHQVMMTARTTDAQAMMNLLYEKLTRPGKAQADFEECRQQELNALGKETTLEQMMKRDPERLINNTVDSLFGNAVKAQYLPCTRHDVEALDLDKMTSYYRRLFGNPDGLTLLFTGSFRTDSLAPIAAATFGRLPAVKAPLPLRDEAFALPSGGQRLRFAHDDSTQTATQCVFATHYEPGLRPTLLFKLMRDILQNRLLSVLRERDNIVYSPFTDVQYRGIPQRVVIFRLYIDVKNENFDRMTRELRTIIDDLRNHPVSTQELKKMKHSFIVTKRQALTDVAPNEWKSVLTTLQKDGGTLDEYNRYDEILRSITPEDVMEGFRRHIDYDKMTLLYQQK